MNRCVFLCFRNSCYGHLIMKTMLSFPPLWSFFLCCSPSSSVGVDSQPDFFPNLSLASWINWIRLEMDFKSSESTELSLISTLLKFKSFRLKFNQILKRPQFFISEALWREYPFLKCLFYVVDLYMVYFMKISKQAFLSMLRFFLSSPWKLRNSFHMFQSFSHKHETDVSAWAGGGAESGQDCLWWIMLFNDVSTASKLLLLLFFFFFFQPITEDHTISLLPRLKKRTFGCKI